MRHIESESRGVEAGSAITLITHAVLVFRVLALAALLAGCKGLPVAGESANGLNL